MNINRLDIEYLLIKEDIEGLLAAGAPEDEYKDESIKIAEALALIEPKEWTAGNILAAISLIWSQNFALKAEEMHLRMRALQRVADSILHLQK